MDKFQFYVESVGLFPLVTSAVLGLIAVIFTPARLRLPLAIVLLFVTTPVGRFLDLGGLRNAAKLLTFPAFLLVGLAAVIDSRPRASLSPLVTAHIILALLAFLFVVTVNNVGTAMLLRTQWLVLVLAAIAVARTVRTEADLRLVLISIWAGSSIAMLLAASNIVLNPDTALRRVGRFEPWGAPSNHIGVTFSLSISLSAYLLFLAKSNLQRLVLVGILGIGLGCALLTGSRSTVATVVIACLPMLFEARKRIGLLALGGGVATVGVLFVVRQFANTRLDRFTDFQSSRGEIALQYLDEVIAERPILGLLETQGAPLLVADEVGKTTHNAYLEAMYLGGIVYALPLILLCLVTLYAAFRVWLARKQSPQPLTYAFLAFFTGTFYAHGFANGAIFYPTYSWAFSQVLMSSVVLSAWMRMGKTGYAFEPEAYSYAPHAYDEYGYDA
ncbi:MAG: hypothetical protein AAF747_08615, partial [Planctomycetota bacterium]